MPVTLLNTRMKYDSLENPHSDTISAIVFPCDSNRHAFETLRSVR